MRPFFPFAALLGVALVLGCQDVGTGPDGLVPQFDKAVEDNDNCTPPRDGHCHGDDEEPASGSLSYVITNIGAITTHPNLDIEGRRGVGKNSQSIDMGAPLTAEQMVFTKAFADVLDDGEKNASRATATATRSLSADLSTALLPLHSARTRRTQQQSTAVTGLRPSELTG